MKITLAGSVLIQLSVHMHVCVTKGTSTNLQGRNKLYTLGSLEDKKEWPHTLCQPHTLCNKRYKHNTEAQFLNDNEHSISRIYPNLQNNMLHVVAQYSLF